MIKAIIVDDAPQVRKLLRLMIADVANEINIIAEAENTTEAIQIIRTEKPDLIFLDIEMPGKSGLQLLDELNENERDFHIIFVTAYNQYAVQAFRLSAMDYLLKPVKEAELIEAIDKFKSYQKLKLSDQRLRTLSSNLKDDTSKVLALPINYGNEYLNVSDIEYIEADNVYANVYMKNGERKMISKHLKYFEDTLCGLEIFVKVHRSFIVNMQHIDSFKKEDRGIIVMKKGKAINLSRSNRQSFLNKFEVFSNMKVLL